MNECKSYSIRLVTLIGIILAITLVAVIVVNITKDTSGVTVAEENTLEEVKVASTDNRNEDLKVSSRSAKREDIESTADEETDDISTEVEESNEVEEINEEVIEENNYISIEDVTISQDMDLTERTGLSKEDFVTLISEVKQDTSGFFLENAETIYDLCEEYELNEIFFCGLISAESGWNIADNHRRTFNYISLMSGGKLIQFDSVEDGLEEAAMRLHNNYLTPGGKFYYGTTLSAVKTKFCPASSTWVGLVYGRMQQIVK